jgi:hypothetical protein
MVIIRLSRLINLSLIRAFDHGRIWYMFLLFPAYQVLATIGIAAIVFSFEAAGKAFYFAPIGLMLAIFIGVPIFASWHLSILLFSVGYFGFFAWLGVPAMPWVTRQVEGAVNWFRAVE